jgi:hypothetical protein
MGQAQLRFSRCKGLYTLSMCTGHLALCAQCNHTFVDLLMYYLHIFVAYFVPTHLVQPVCHDHLSLANVSWGCFFASFTQDGLQVTSM